MTDGNTAYTLGRFQGYGNHHDAALRLLTENSGEEVETLYVGILRTPPDARSYHNPFTHEEVKQMVETAYETDYDPPYGVEPFVFGDNPFLHRQRMEAIAGADTTFLTRERHWKLVADALGAIEQVLPEKTREIDTFYVPRDHGAVERVADYAGYEVVPCSGDIRQMIADGDDAWRRYVSPSVADLIDEEYDEATAAIRDASGRGIDKFNLVDRVQEYLAQALPAQYGQPEGSP
ncbi:MAG: hypothetical protein SVY41_02000 [Candidatus Nanohaloarchaea archaeon]|nr:hypothetical protein [Candidatus Nanohaloarchaea archaeon]